MEQNIIKIITIIYSYKETRELIIIYRIGLLHVSIFKAKKEFKDVLELVKNYYPSFKEEYKNNNILKIEPIAERENECPAEISVAKFLVPLPEFKFREPYYLMKKINSIENFISNIKNSTNSISSKNNPK
jgi:hypothetical protein